MNTFLDNLWETLEGNNYFTEKELQLLKEDGIIEYNEDLEA